MSESKGRPSVTINFPTSGEFGMSELVALNPTVSRVTLQLRVNKGLQAGSLSKVGSRQVGKGRPASVFAISNTRISG